MTEMPADPGLNLEFVDEALQPRPRRRSQGHSAAHPRLDRLSPAMPQQSASVPGHEARAHRCRFRRREEAEPRHPRISHGARICGRRRHLHGVGRRAPRLSASAKPASTSMSSPTSSISATAFPSRAGSISIARPSARPTCCSRKMQIVEINLKDFKDTIVLMLEHPLSDQQAGPKAIDVDYIVDIMRQDWGFYYTFTTNLKRVPDHLGGVFLARRGRRGLIRSRIDALLEHDRSRAEDARLADALEDRHPQPLVPGGLRKVGAVLKQEAAPMPPPLSSGVSRAADRPSSSPG